MNLNYKDFFKSYIRGDLKLKTYQKVGVFMFIMVVAGFVGWVWEFLLTFISHGFQVYAKGGNLLPWINIYAYGAILIIGVSYRFRKKPWLVFVSSFFITGLLELLAGWLVYTIGNGTRYWDYRTEFWGFGNINGFVCPMSATAFGIGALFLIYWFLPRCIHLSMRMSKRAFLALTITLFILVMTDEITNLTLKNLGLPTAMDFYRSLGLKYPT